jgi:hypothetical protein
MGEISDDEPAIISYKNLRRLIGILGISLPLLCLAGLAISRTALEPSISHCYYSNVRDVFIGVMIGVSMFLISYYGYGPVDNIVTNITGGAGMALALCPCLFSYADPSLNRSVGFLNLDPYLSNALHLGCASVFFLLLAFNSLFLFTRTRDGEIVRDGKKKRNVVYVVCGVAMVALMIALVVIRLVLGDERFDSKPIAFAIESLMLLAFGISWLVKGETIFQDEPEPKTD